MNEAAQLYRLKQVLSILQISRSAWYSGIKTGRFPAPIKLGARTSAWRARDIHEIAENGAQGDAQQ